VGENSGLAISGLRKKLADSTSANPLILDFILTNLHLKYTNSYIFGIPRNSMYFFVSGIPSELDENK
jgi:hypothetical protein